MARDSFRASGRTTTSFTKMGTSAATMARNASGEPSRFTTPVAKQGGVGGMLADATANHRRNKQERLGASYAPKAQLVWPNSPEAGTTQRNTRTIPSASGFKDFWASREYRQGLS